jgi:hypothetical protein
VARRFDKTTDRQTRAGLEVELIQLRNRAAGGDLTDADRADIELRLKLLLAHAKLRGWIVDRKQIASASTDLGRFSPEDMQANLEQYVDAMEPGARREIETRLRALAERAKRTPRVPRELAPPADEASGEGSSAQVLNLVPGAEHETR